MELHIWRIIHHIDNNIYRTLLFNKILCFFMISFSYFFHLLALQSLYMLDN